MAFAQTATIDWNTLLNTAIVIAAEAHIGQTDKGGNPYILHPLRVMMKMECIKTKIVAVLHDTIEDTRVTAEFLREQGFPYEIIEAILSVSKNSGEKYFDAIGRAKLNALGRKVKIGDLEDNSDLTRIPNPADKDFKRIIKYAKALEMLRF